MVDEGDPLPLTRKLSGSVYTSRKSEGRYVKLLLARGRSPRTHGDLTGGGRGPIRGRPGRFRRDRRGLEGLSFTPRDSTF